MIMACLEWFLWLAAFVYCLVKVWQKSEHWSINMLCIIVGLSFILFRYVASETNTIHELSRLKSGT